MKSCNYFIFQITILIILLVYHSIYMESKNMLFSNINSNILFLVLFTSNIFIQLMNFYISSIKKLNITNIIFISLDLKGYYITKKLLPNVFMSNNHKNISEHIDYNTPLYWRIVYSKTDYVKYFLIKKMNVILCDTDIILFKNPIIYLLKYEEDLVTSCDHYCPTMNSGL